MGKIQNQVATTNQTGGALRPIDKLKEMLNADSIQEQFENVLKENKGAFLASVIDLFNTDKTLQACEPRAVVMEALKAASLKLPVNKQLGFSWIVPYKSQGVFIPTFEIGYKGYIQLALRTGAYRYINGDVVYEGELTRRDKLTGEVELGGEKISEKKVGYFAFLETLNGFRKTVYMTTEEVTAHAKRFSKSYTYSSSPWTTDFDQMAIKTCFRALISKYGLMSVEMQNAFTNDGEMVTMADQATAGAQQVDDGDTIDVEYQPAEVQVTENESV